MKSNNSDSQAESAAPIDIFTRMSAGKAQIFNRADVEAKWPMFRIATALCKTEQAHGSAPPPIGSVLVPNVLLSAPRCSEHEGRTLIVKLESMFEGHVKKLAVQQPYLANWFSLDFNPDATASTGHWYLNMSDGSRYLFAIALAAIQQAVDGGSHAHVMFVAGDKVAVGAFSFNREDVERAQELERTVRDDPKPEPDTQEAGFSQAEELGTSTPWVRQKYKLVTGAWRQHLNCIWIGLDGRDVETRVIG